MVLDSNSPKYGGNSTILRYEPFEGDMHGYPQYISVDVAPNSVIYLKAGKAKKRKKRVEKTVKRK